jgi:NADH dehydrogenase
MTSERALNDLRDVVIVGGGVAGIDIASHLAGRKSGKASLRVTLVDRESAHVWKPMLHTVAAGTRDVHQQQTSFVAQARRRGFSYQPGEVTAIDTNARRVQIAPWQTARGREILGAREIRYDTLVLAVGSRANDFGTPGVAEHCHAIDTRSQAIAFNDELRIRLVHASARSAELRIGIVGGGATGVELAAQLVALKELSEYYGAVNLTGKMSVILLESGPRLLAAFPERVASAARERLEKLGVIVRVGAEVAAAEARGFRLVGSSLIEADLMVWAAGVKAPALMSTLVGLELTKNHQAVIGLHLRTTRDENIYAVGDCSSLTPPGMPRPLPTTAQVAHQQARYLCDHLPALLAGRSAPDFKYHDFGSLVSLGGYGAYGSLGKFGFFKGGFIRGRVAQLGHALLYREHQARLRGFWTGGLLWLVDQIDSQVRPAIRLD